MKLVNSLFVALLAAALMVGCATNRTESETKMEREVERPGPDYEEKYESETETDRDPGELETETETEHEIEDGPDELDAKTKSDLDVEHDGDEVEITRKSKTRIDADGAAVSVSVDGGDSAGATGMTGELRMSGFEKGEAILSDEDKAMLRDRAKEFTATSQPTIIIEGHADEVAAGTYDIALAERRAENVVQYLRGVGVDTTRLEIVRIGDDGSVIEGTMESASVEPVRVEIRSN